MTRAIFLILLSSKIFAQHPDVIFTKQVNNNDNFYLVNHHGELKQITDHARKDSSPMLSPDGKSLVFTSERVGWWKIWRMDLVKNNFTQLTHSGAAQYSPVWSPDGKKIVFVSGGNGKQDLYVMDYDGQNMKNITNDNKANLMPFWADDDRIYFSAQIDGVYQIVSCKPDGSDQRVITKSRGNKFMPQLSNDCKQILFYGDQDGNLEIYLLHIRALTTKRLTNHALMDMRPRWSDDNEWIVFERGNKGNNHHIYLMKSDGSNLKKLTTKNYNYTPSFVPAIPDR